MQQCSGGGGKRWGQRDLMGLSQRDLMGLNGAIHKYRKKMLKEKVWKA